MKTAILILLISVALVVSAQDTCTTLKTLFGANVVKCKALPADQQKPCMRTTMTGQPEFKKYIDLCPVGGPVKDCIKNALEADCQGITAAAS